LLIVTEAALAKLFMKVRSFVGFLSKNETATHPLVQPTNRMRKPSLFAMFALCTSYARAEN